MVRAYIYLISFKNTNDIYIGKTKQRNIEFRFAEHKKDYYSTVNSYVRNKLNGDWSNVYIDVIDSVDMNEDLTHLLKHPLNTIPNPKFNNFKKYTSHYKTKEGLLNHKLAYIEHFHIHNYKNDGKYNLINKKITNGYDAYDVYKFYNNYINND
jgi:hypothetical protein